MRFGSTAKVLLECKLKYYKISEWDVLQGTTKFGSTAKVPAKCKLKYYKISVQGLC